MTGELNPFFNAEGSGEWVSLPFFFLFFLFGGYRLIRIYIRYSIVRIGSRLSFRIFARAGGDMGVVV